MCSLCQGLLDAPHETLTTAFYLHERCEIVQARPLTRCAQLVNNRAVIWIHVARLPSLRLDSGPSLRVDGCTVHLADLGPRQRGTPHLIRGFVL